MTHEPARLCADADRGRRGARRAAARRRVSLPTAQLARDPDDRCARSARGRRWIRSTCSARRRAGTRRRTPGALGGIGIGVKDIIATADMPTTMGSPIFADHRPPRDAACVARLRAAGAFVFGKTVTTPFAFMDPGKTRNPWDPAHTPGGSSSGSAAAVAVGHVRAAHRHADQWLGHPSRGLLRRRRIQADARTPFRSRACICSARRSTPSARSRAPWRMPRCSRACWPIPAASPERWRRSRSAPRFAYLGDFPWTAHDCDADAVVEAAVTQLRTRAEVVPVDIPAGVARSPGDACGRSCCSRPRATSANCRRANARACRPRVNAALDEGATIGDDALRDGAVRARTGDRVLHAMARRLRRGRWRRRRPAPAPRGLATTGDPSCCTLWSLLGFPAISLPVGLVRRMPIGLQLAAPQRLRRSVCWPSAAWCGARLPFRGLV